VQLHHAVDGLSTGQLQWVSGYVAGLAVAGNSQLAGAQVVADPGSEPGNSLTILYGSQTGNGREIAARLLNRARRLGFAVNLKSLADFKPVSLKRENLVTFVISTHGEGDPPDDAELFFEFILSPRAPKLPNLQYSVLALGDSSYINFCQTGRELDARLADLGAERLETLVECDLDFEDAANVWTEKVLEMLPRHLPARSAVPHLHAVGATSQYDKHRPFPAEVLVNQKITGAGSTKDVRHVELSLEGSGIKYEPGDSLAVVVENPPQLVEQLLCELGFDAGATVTVQNEGTTVEGALSRKFEITLPSLGFLHAWAGFSDAAELRTLLQPGEKAALTELVETHQIIDVIRRYPASVEAADFIGSLRRLSPRSYSIASSQAANPDEVHLTVAVVRYRAFGSEHWGAASTHLADRIKEGETVSVHVEANPRFSLPEDDTAIIMIGPGTGVAPFRAFVEERAERGATGKNWLIFGDRNFSSDFLYQLEWQRHLKQGRLQRLDVAFSRDQKDKIYVQKRIREHGEAIYSWLENGAVIYVCGDAKHMAGDVNQALVEVIAAQANMSLVDAATRLKELRRDGRYQRDVY
jgi:sulfite reductase (NADPH) flavoprotein alpha-component